MLGEAPSPPSPDASGPTTTSGFPIAPVYAGAAVTYNFRPVLRATKAAFLGEQFYRNPNLGAEYINPYVPHTAGPRGGIDVQRHMAGTGIPFSDPLDLFKMGRSDIDKKRQPVRRPSRPLDSHRLRHKSESAYRKMNKDNVDAGRTSD